MDKGALVTTQIDAARRFLRRFEESTPVVVAYWLKDDDDAEANLYLASSRFNSSKLRGAYAEVIRIAQDLNDPNFDPFRVKLVGLSEHMVRAALDFYTAHPPSIPFHIREGNVGNLYVDEIYLLKGPTGEYAMPTGREVLNQIIDQEAAFFEQHGKPPRKIKLPVLMAYDLAKCGRDILGELSGRVFKDGINTFEKEGLHGMSVEIVRDRDAALAFE